LAGVRENTNGNGGIQQFQPVNHVIVEVFGRVGHRFTHQGAGGEVEYGLGFGFLHRLEEVTFHLRSTKDKLCARLNGRAMPFAQIVINGHSVARVEQSLRANRADIPRPARNKYVHERVS
jgi:hypothetical protein